MEVLVPKRNVIMDATILSSLMSCPRLMDIRFNHNLVSNRGKSVSLEMGSIVHKVLEVFYKHQIEGFKRELCIAQGMTAGREYASDPTEVQNSSPEDIELALSTSEQYFEFYKNDSWVPLEVESVRGEILYEDDEVRVLWKAKYDLIADSNQGIFPIDHKTMKQRRDTLSLNNQFMGQCILLNTRTVFVNKIGFQTSLKPNEKFMRVGLSYTADRLMEWRGTILPYYAKLMLMYDESGYFPPNFTHCENKYGFCAYKQVCEVDSHMREEVLMREYVVTEKWDPTND